MTSTTEGRAEYGTLIKLFLSILATAFLFGCQTGGGHNAVWQAKLKADADEKEAKIRRRKATVGQCLANAYPADQDLAGKAMRLSARTVTKEGGKAKTNDVWEPCEIPSPTADKSPQKQED